MRFKSAFFESALEIINKFEYFWQRHPAFFLALTVFHSALCVLTWHWVAFASLLIFCMSAPKRFILIAVLSSASFLFMQFYLENKTIGIDEGEAMIEIKEVRKVRHYGRIEYRAQGTLLHFQSKEHTLHNQPISFSSSKLKSIQSNRIIAEGKLIQKGPNRFWFRPSQIKELPPTFSLVWNRFWMKQNLKRVIQKSMTDRRSADLMYSLLSGEVDNLELRILFNRLGLGHLLAISGFHFSIVMGAIAFVLARSKRIYALGILILVTTLYFLFLGDLASVKRAYFMLLMILVGEVFSLRGSSLNTLGVCVLLLLIFDPFLLHSLGFILSALATLSLLLFYRPMYQLFSYLLPVRSKHEVTQLLRLAKWGYRFVCFLRGALSVNLSVMVLCLPFLLFKFDSFPLLSLYYNLWVPLYIGLLLILGGIALLISPLFIPLNGLAKGLIVYLECFPRNLDFQIHVQEIAPWLLMVLIQGSLYMGIYLNQVESEKRLVVTNS